MHHHSQTRLPPFCPKVPAVSCTNISHRLGSAWWCQWAVKGEGKILMLFGVWCQMITVFMSLWVTLMRFWPLTSLIIMLPSNYCRADFYNSMIYTHICELWFFVGMKKRHSNLSAHVSPAFRVKEGDKVVIGQCRLDFPLGPLVHAYNSHFCLNWSSILSCGLVCSFLYSEVSAFHVCLLVLLVFFVRSEISITLLQ